MIRIAVRGSNMRFTAHNPGFEVVHLVGYAAVDDNHDWNISGDLVARQQLRKWLGVEHFGLKDSYDWHTSD